MILNTTNEKLPLATGEKVKFTTRNGKEIIGTVITKGEGNIVVETDNGERIPLFQIVGNSDETET